MWTLVNTISYSISANLCKLHFMMNVICNFIGLVPPIKDVHKCTCDICRCTLEKPTIRTNMFVNSDGHVHMESILYASAQMHNTYTYNSDNNANSD